MIGYLEGQVLHFDDDGILLLAGGVGYEVLLNPQLIKELQIRHADSSAAGMMPGDQNEKSGRPFIALYIYYHQTERQPKPVLIGFRSLEDKSFFQMFITVSAIGPMKAVKAMSEPVGKIAQAIEKKDVPYLTGLSGIGKRTAQKIIATLNGKVEKFLIPGDDKIHDDSAIPEAAQNISQQVQDVLVEQLGHSLSSAKRMIKEAFERNQGISTPEQLFDEVFGRGN